MGDGTRPSGSAPRACPGVLSKGGDGARGAWGDLKERWRPPGQAADPGRTTSTAKRRRGSGPGGYPGRRPEAVPGPGLSPSAATWPANSGGGRARCLSEYAREGKPGCSWTGRREAGRDRDRADGGRGSAASALAARRRARTPTCRASHAAPPPGRPGARLSLRGVRKTGTNGPFGWPQGPSGSLTPSPSVQDRASRARVRARVTLRDILPAFRRSVPAFWV